MRLLAAMPLLLLAPSGAAAVSPRVRVWAATRIELAASARTDEAGARWIEVRGRLRTERGEPVAGAELRFARGGTVERAATGADGAFRTVLRAGAGSWTARFEGGERLRPSVAVVPAPPPSAADRGWMVFVPLLALGAALALAGTLLLARRLRGAVDRLAAAWRGRRSSRRARARAGAPPEPAAERLRRARVIDALRFRPVAGARLERALPPPGLLAVAAADGSLEVPVAGPPAVVRAPGYVGLPLGVAPQDGDLAGGDPSAEVLPLLRARDAVVGWLEASRRGGGMFSAAALETVGQMAVRVVPGETAALLAAICYGPPHAPDDRARAALAALRGLAAGAPDAPVPPAGPDAAAVAEALAGEAAAVPRG